ncbi:MAG: hypothetical protein HYY30_12155 [Chloroflexi bacterium]|nr:hypothetical protein [Chloroflexota bacterium]
MRTGFLGIWVTVLVAITAGIALVQARTIDLAPPFGVLDLNQWLTGVAAQGEYWSPSGISERAKQTLMNGASQIKDRGTQRSTESRSYPLSEPFVPSIAAPDTTVVNAGSGIIYYPWANPSVEGRSYVSGRSLSVTWKDFEPREGDFQWQRVENALANLPSERKVWFAIHNFSYPDRTITPEWVFTAGARWVPSTYNSSVKIPVYWDPVFKAKWEATIGAFAARYDGDPRLLGMKITGQGHYGEMVPEWDRVRNGDRQTWADVGYTFDGWVAQQKWAIDMYMNYFQKTPAAISIVNDTALWGESPATTVLDYGVNKYGMRLYPKWDGAGPNMRGVPNILLRYLPQTDVLFEEEGSWFAWGNGTSEQWRQQAEQIVASRASFVWVFAQEFDKGDPQGNPYNPEMEWLAKYIGPQLFIADAYVTATASAGKQARLSLRWGNRGNVPLRGAQRVEQKDIPASALVFIDLVAADGNTAAHYEYQPTVPTTQWYPNTIVDDSVMLNLPSDLSGGTYEVRVGIYNPRPYAQGAHFNLLNEDRNDGFGRYTVGWIEVSNDW